MDNSWIALLGVLSGAILTIAASTWQQRRLWSREDSLRREEWKREREQRLRDQRYDAFQEFLAASNRINAIRNELVLMLDSGEVPGYPSRVSKLREKASECYSRFQESLAVYMLVGDDEPLRVALGKLTKETYFIRQKIEALEPIYEADNRAFKDARRACEQQMSKYLFREPRAPA